jgi:hypothetical protein
MAASDTGTALARALDGRYARSASEACALIREALTTSGDIIPGEIWLAPVRGDVAGAPRLSLGGRRRGGRRVRVRRPAMPPPGLRRRPGRLRCPHPGWRTGECCAA